MVTPEDVDKLLDTYIALIDAIDEHGEPFEDGFRFLWNADDRPGAFKRAEEIFNRKYRNLDTIKPCGIDIVQPSTFRWEE